MKKTMSWILLIVLVLQTILTGCSSKKEIEFENKIKTDVTYDLSPLAWEDEDKYMDMNLEFSHEKPLVAGENGMVSVTSNALAARAGMEALNNGGTAADAAMAAALTQITLAGGSYVSFAGNMTVIYYDAETEKTYAINGEYNTPMNEKNPETIPGKDDGPSGRTALVPGFLKALDETHERFGTLAYEDLYDASIYYAEEGFPVPAVLASIFEKRQDVLSRLEGTRDVFIKPDGTIYEEGEIFKQPALAETLKILAKEGSDYFYEGAWAEKCIELIQADGGKMTLDDLKNYEVIFTEAEKTDYDSYTLAAAPAPSQGGRATMLALKLLNEGDISSIGHYTESAEAFRLATNAVTANTLYHASDFMLKLATKSLFVTKDKLLEDKYVEKLWKLVEDDTLSASAAPAADDNKHSDAIVVVDKWGNMVSLVHTINSVHYGNTGIVVDGISIGDPASFQQNRMVDIKPGDRLPSTINPMLVFKDGEPFLAQSAMHTGLFEKTILSLYNIMEFGMSIEEAQNVPSVYSKTHNWLPIDLDLYPEGFKEELEELGVYVDDITVSDGGYFKEVMPDKNLLTEEEWRRYIQDALDGYWIAIKPDFKNNTYEGIAAKYSNGGVATDTAD